MKNRWASLAIFVGASLCCGSALAQNKDAKSRLLVARAQYYTPTVRGLESFRCEASIDWKDLFARLRQTETADDPELKYLQAVHLSVVDELNGSGSLEWTDTETPPQGQEAKLKQVHDGLQTMTAGFFQSWNAYMNGGMVPVPDDTSALTPDGDGIHLNARAPGMQVAEYFDKDTVLTQAVVVTASAKIVALPTYVRTDDGLLVSAVISHVNQPPSAPEIEVSFQVEYAKVGAFRLPSRVVYDVKNVARIEFRMTGCQTSAANSTRKP